MEDKANGTEEIFSSDEFTSRKSSGVTRSKAWYMVVLMSLCYGVGELSHFLVGTTSRAMSQDLEYGDQSCLRNHSFPTELNGGNATCSDYLDEQT